MLADNYFTVTQASNYLMVTRQTIHRWIKDGQFNTERVGRECLIAKSEIERLRCPTCGQLRRKK